MMIEGIPDSWRIVELRDIATLIGGGTPNRKSRAFFNGTIPWITGTDFIEGEITQIGSSREYITDEAIESSATNLVPEFSVLLTTRVNVGKVAINQVPLCFSQDITAIVIKNNQIADFKYITYFFLANRNKLLRFNRGTTISGIRRNDLARIKIPLPTLPEQQEIVKILSLAERLRKFRIEADRQTELLALSTFTNIFGFIDKNTHYQQVRLEKIANIVSGVTKGRNLPTHETVNVPYLRVANVQAGYLDLSEIKTIDVLPSDIEKYALQQGDVLLTEGGDFDKLGRGAIWEYDIPNCIHQNHVFRVRVDRNVLLPLFFNYYLQTAYARHYFLRAAKRTTNLASINISQLSALPVPLPPIEMQEKFVSSIIQVHSILETQKKSSAEINRLAQVSLIKALSGALTQTYREQNLSTLMRYANERDAILKQPSLAEEKLDKIAQVPERSIAQSFLSSSQRALLASIKEQGVYATNDNLELENDLTSSEVRRNLDLLTQLGLIKAVSIAVTPGELGRVFFTKTYRTLQPEDDLREADLAILRGAQKE